jgi:CRP-like cAMP-binding protein
VNSARRLKVSLEPDPKLNQLLAALPDAQRAPWLPQLELIDMPLGKVLYEPGTEMTHVYFPTTSIVSLLYVLENGASAEIAVVGNEGIVGVSLFMGGGSTLSRAVVQSAGQGLRLRATAMMHEFNRAGPVLHWLLRYTQALITQMSQTAVCNRHHSVDKQLCRWLLLSLDRLQSNQLVMTQELIANMLGVRREGVTEAAGHLHRAGLIDYQRGHITVLDRPALEQRSCECYAVVKKEYDRLLPATMAVQRVVDLTGPRAAGRQRRTGGRGAAPPDRKPHGKTDCLQGSLLDPPCIAPILMCGSTHSRRLLGSAAPNLASATAT